jgi:hypothetical protein
MSWKKVDEPERITLDENRRLPIELEKIKGDF